MKKTILFLMVLFITIPAYAENWIADYGFYENKNEIKAKDRLIGSLNNIYDFENSNNPGGEKILDGKYYIETKYKGGNNGTDADYIYLDEMFYDDTDLKKQDKKHTKVNKKQDKKHTKVNKKQDNKISNNKEAISNNSSRISELEETQYIVGGVIRVHDSQKWQVNTFADYSTNRNMFDRVGVRFTYKIGKSYEEKQLDELERKIDRMNNQSLIERDNMEVMPTETGFILQRRF